MRVFNRDAVDQGVDPSQFALWRSGEDFRTADYVRAPAPLRPVAKLGSGHFARGRLWFYAGNAHASLLVRWYPADGSPSSGVWLVARDDRPVSSATGAPA